MFFVWRGAGARRDLQVYFTRPGAHRGYAGLHVRSVNGLGARRGSAGLHVSPVDVDGQGGIAQRRQDANCAVGSSRLCRSTIRALVLGEAMQAFM